MKRSLLLITGILLWLSMATLLQASVLLFYDNFEQFPNGTDLTETNYMPGTRTAPGAYAQTETNEMAGGSAVVSNFLGSQRLFINAPAGQHFEYDAKLYGDKNLSSAVTDQVMNVQWLSWIQATTSLTATGGSAVDISSTNLDIYCDGSSCTTNLQSNVFLFFADYGAIYVFTNNVGSLSGPFPMVQIGTWSNYVGQVMTNQLTLNYRANTFSFSLNNTVLTNHMTLPSMFTNILSEIDFTCVENFPISSGNRFALDDILLTIFTPAITAIQVMGRTNAIVGFTTLLGTSYDVERNDEIGVQVWTNFIQNVPGTGGIVQTNDTFSASLQKRFYRVRLLP